MFLFIDADGVASREGRINFTETKGREEEKGEKAKAEGGGGEREREREGGERRKGINADHRLMLDGRSLVAAPIMGSNNVRLDPRRSDRITKRASRRRDELSSVQQARSFLHVVLGS